MFKKPADKRRKKLFNAQETFCAGIGNEVVAREIVFQPKFEISAKEIWKPPGRYLQQN